MTTQSTKEHPSQQTLVSITIDGTSREVERGSYQVSKLKERLGVPADYELEEVKNGELKPLQDHQHTAIQGGEVFVSHVRRGGAA